MAYLVGHNNIVTRLDTKDYDTISGYVGGLIERLPYTDKGKAKYDCWVNEEGFNMDLPVNRLAWDFALDNGYYVGGLGVRGNMVIAPKRKSYMNELTKYFVEL